MLFVALLSFSARSQPRIPVALVSRVTQLAFHNSEQNRAASVGLKPAGRPVVTG